MKIDLTPLFEQLNRIESKLDSLAKPPVLGPNPNNPPKPEPIVDPIPTLSDSLQKHGGSDYFRFFNKTIEILGNKVYSQGLFKVEDVGKKFLGFKANKNPHTVDGDKYYPSILGSRYATVTKFISENEIEVDFNFNTESDCGYIFFDNSTAWEKMIENENEIVLNSGSVYVIPTIVTKVLDTSKNYSFTTTGIEAAILQFGIEDFFRWSQEQPKYQALFILDDGSNSFTSKNITWTSPQRFFQETDTHRIYFFDKQPINPKFSRTILIQDNYENKFKFEGANNMPLSLGFHYSGKTDDYNVLALIGGDYKGITIADIKAGNGNKIAHIAKNINASYQEKDYYTPKFLSKVKVLEEGKLQKIQLVNSDNSFYNITTLYQSGWNNRASLAQIDRFTFWLPYGNRKNILDNWYGIKVDSMFDSTNHVIDSIPRAGEKYWVSKNYQIDKFKKSPYDITQNKIRSIVNWSLINNKSLSETTAKDSKPIEFQVGDQFKIVGKSEIYTVKHKERGDGFNLNWLFEIDWFKKGEDVNVPTTYRYSSLTLDKNLDISDLAFEIEIVKSNAEILLDGQERDAWIIYKGSNYINQNANHRFGDESIILSSNISSGMPYYNFENVSLYMENSDYSINNGLNSYYRMSGNGFVPDFRIHENVKGLGGQWTDEQIGNLPVKIAFLLSQLK